ncbi:hypothetical protein DFP72DRAFT_851229 [Ephemerocybe angulata]|uniref:Uncharacterized protein n=1 Tax=Ephemerocybe angulata TaxID=980116 RepID=A0A8H6HQQ6_9AGAR|nr:hypothetical protein DFP72DRAFT_851229 [Tulosesus angulatus]
MTASPGLLVTSATHLAMRSFHAALALRTHQTSDRGQFFAFLPVEAGPILSLALSGAISNTKAFGTLAQSWVATDARSRIKLAILALLQGLQGDTPDRTPHVRGDGTA